MASRTAELRSTTVKGGRGAIEWSATARVLASGRAETRAKAADGSEERESVLGTAVAQATAAGGSDDRGVKTAAGRAAE